MYNLSVSANYMSEIATTIPVAEPTSLDLQDILKILPHRYPFLLIDRVTELVRDQAHRGHQERHHQ